MENSVVPSNEMEASQPANPESGEDHDQPEDTGTKRDISSSTDSLEERRKKLYSDASVEEEDKGHEPFKGQVPMFLSKKTELEKYFKPSIVSIGPLHYDKNKLMQGQHLKKQMVAVFIGENRKKETIIYKNILKEIESFKEFYDQQKLLEKFHGNDEDLACIFLVDGCAMIQFVRCWLWGELSAIPSDQMDLWKKDLLLLDNQLPLGVLNLVMSFGKKGGDLYQSKEFRYRISWFINTMAMPNFKVLEMGIQAGGVCFDEANHLLGLLWMNLAINKDIEYYISCYSEATPTPFRTVKELQAEGIILEPNDSSSSLRDISFNCGKFHCKLKIPSFRISEQGKFLVFNLIAFELDPNFYRDHVVTSYICFLNSLMTSIEDVVELRREKILFNDLQNDEEVLKTFQELTSSLTSYHDIFSLTKEELQFYLNDKKRIKFVKWINEALEIYFKSSWTTISFVSATFLLILTVIQNIFSILAYADQRK